jgi:hypothetical protein
MVNWRCPHCGAPQSETARCWVCHGSTTSCSTCRHFRRGITLRTGYCALDQRRSPLTGDEQFECWELPAGQDGDDEADLASHGLWDAAGGR